MKTNILNKPGMLTDEDRKQPLEHGCNHFSFKTNLDLTEPIEVFPYGGVEGGTVKTVDQYSQDVASFICWWTNFVMKDLNGFSGFSHVKFKLIGFTLQQ